MWTRCCQTYGFVLLRQKNALPSGIGRIFSLGGARSAIFNWTPPSDRRGGEVGGEEEFVFITMNCASGINKYIVIMSEYY